jgi:hypothetical protein
VQKPSASPRLIMDFVAKESPRRLAPPLLGGELGSRPSSPRSSSNPRQIRLELVLAVILSPEVQRQAGEFVDFRNRRGIAREIHDLKIAFAAIAGLKSQMRKSSLVKLDKLLSLDSLHPGSGCGGVFRTHTNLNTEHCRTGTKQWTG